MSDSKKKWLSLGSTLLSAEIDPHGAQLSILRDSERRNLLWNGDVNVWSGRAPLLFPIVGALAAGHYRIGAKSYALPRHGFARGRPFDVVGSTASEAKLRLSADEATMGVYPFRFQLDVEFEICAATLTIVTRISNLGRGDMPASFGYHPALRWPLPYEQPRAAHTIEFERDEPARIRRLDGEGLLTSEPHPSPIVERRLALTDDLFANDALILDAVQSRYVTYGAPGGPRLRVSYPDAPYLGIWSKPGANFICIEPWHGMADPVGFAGEFRDKPGVFTVAEGNVVSCKMQITLMEN